METKGSDDDVALPFAWVDLDDAEIQLANQFASQFHNDIFFISVGAFAPPLLLGSEEEKRKKARELPFVPIRTVARFAVTEAMLEELVSLLQTSLDKYQETKKQEGS